MVCFLIELSYFRKIEDLTQYCNKQGLDMNDLADEVEELRERLGLDPREPIDMEDYKKKKKLRQQEDRALNIILTKDVRYISWNTKILKF